MKLLPSYDEYVEAAGSSITSTSVMHPALEKAYEELCVSLSKGVNYVDKGNSFHTALKNQYPKLRKLMRSQGWDLVVDYQYVRVVGTETRLYAVKYTSYTERLKGIFCRVRRFFL
jgi:hypothetical protein